MAAIDISRDFRLAVNGLVETMRNANGLFTIHTLRDGVEISANSQDRVEVGKDFVQIQDGNNRSIQLVPFSAIARVMVVGKDLN